jgi:hypothetical protein
MIWLTWRQFRAQAVVAAAMVGALAITLAVTGPHLAALYASSGLTACHAACSAQASSFIDAVKGTNSELIFYGGVFLLYAVPGLIGIFWGAPLLTRELESGTFRLAWNQSVTRSRWLAVKLGLTGLAAAATAGLVSLMLSWWSGPLYAAAGKAAGQNSLSISRLGPPLFSATGLAPAGYALFAFALGVTAGVLVRRTVPAMAITLAIFAAVQILMPSLVRQHLIPPVTTTQALSTVTFNGLGLRDNNRLVLQVAGIDGRTGDWIVSDKPVNAAGQPVVFAPLKCAGLTSTFVSCLSANGIRMQVSYQPSGRYWAFQWLETGIFVALALGLGGVCGWRVRRLS